MLTMLEEIILLAVDETTGTLQRNYELGGDYALVGAVFFDLALTNKIDTDTETLHILDASPTGNLVLDRVLVDMAARPNLTSVRDWVEQLFRRRDDLEGDALASLVRQGILRHEKSKRLWIIDVERFPMADSRLHRQVKKRVADAVLTDTIPGTRDIMLVSIADAFGLLGCVLTAQQVASRQSRIRMLCSLETISRKVIAALSDLDATQHNVPRIF
jgi:Golgi phosphoprotein 3